MSLTSILKAGAGEKTRGKLPPKHLEFLEAVEQIKLDSSSRRIDCGRDGKIEVYRLSSPSTAAKCGMAFDYLARLEVARYCGSDRFDVLENTAAGTGVGLLVDGRIFKRERRQKQAAKRKNVFFLWNKAIDVRRKSCVRDMLRRNRFAGGCSSGPYSSLLYGWEDSSGKCAHCPLVVQPMARQSPGFVNERKRCRADNLMCASVCRTDIFHSAACRGRVPRLSLMDIFGFDIGDGAQFFKSYCLVRSSKSIMMTNRNH